MQAGSYSWRGGEGSQTDLNGDDRKPPARVHDPRYPKNPDAFCCDEGEDTAAIARSQPATGFVYMVNRFYEPETGRFTQADSLAFDPTQLTNAQNNRWTYCGNDPVNFSDPSGMFAWSAFLITLLVGILFSIGFYFGWGSATTRPGATPCSTSDDLFAIAFDAVLGSLIGVLGLDLLSDPLLFIAFGGQIKAALILGILAFAAGWIAGRYLGEIFTRVFGQDEEPYFQGRRQESATCSVTPNCIERRARLV
jgi:RHS repeat-associated protein